MLKSFYEVNRTVKSNIINHKIKYHFLIDNDGTIYQTCDMQHITFHAGNTNKFAIK